MRDHGMRPQPTNEGAYDGYRARVRDWLRTEAPRRGWAVEGVGVKPRASASDADGNAAAVQRARDCQRALYDAGFAGIPWPKAFAGQGLTLREQVIFNQEAAQYRLPRTPFAITLGMCIPTVLAVGSDAQKMRYVPPVLRSEELWCQ